MPSDFRKRYQKNYQPEYHKEWYKQNKDRYKRRWMARLGNPKQDEQFLKILEDKRKGMKTINYNKLPGSSFKYNNQANLPRYKDEIISGVVDHGF